MWWLRRSAAFLGAFGLGWLGGFFIPPFAVRPPVDSYYADRLDFLRSFPVQADTAMLGDSLTQYADWNVLFPGQRIANLGISGDRVATMLQRLDTVAVTGAHRVFLLAGVNDLKGGTPVDQTFAKYRAILEALRGHDLTVQSTFPTRGQWGWTNDSIRALNKRLAEYCSGDPCRFLDLTPTMSFNGELRSDFTNDGLHLNAKGYRAWRDAIAPVVAEMEPSASR